MKTKGITAGCLALALVFLFSASAWANRREWARAGRILTGYAVIRTLAGDPFWPSYPYGVYDPYLTYGRHGYRTRVWVEPYPSVFTPYPAAHYRPRPYRRISRPPPGDPPERWDSRPAALRGDALHPDAEREPLVVPLPDGRRLYQPPTAGSPSYVQVWSEAEEKWVSVAEMPPLR